METQCGLSHLCHFILLVAQFLEKALVPLFRPRALNSYFQQLCYCVVQYLEKVGLLFHLINQAR